MEDERHIKMEEVKKRDGQGYGQGKVKKKKGNGGKMKEVNELWLGSIPQMYVACR